MNSELYEKMRNFEPIIIENTKALVEEMEFDYSTNMWTLGLIFLTEKHDDSTTKPVTKPSKKLQKLQKKRSMGGFYKKLSWKKEQGGEDDG